MCYPEYRFQINGMWFVRVNPNSTVAGTLMTYKEAEALAYGRPYASYTAYYTSPIIPTQIKKNNSIPPRKKDLKF